MTQQRIEQPQSMNALILIGSRLGARPRMRGSSPLKDDALASRVRAAIKKSSSFPNAIEVIARDGFVQLRGAILQDDVDDVIRGVERVRGVVAIDSELAVCASRDAPELRARMAHRSPRAGRIAIATLAGALGVFGLAKRGRLGFAVSVLGALLVLGARIKRSRSLRRARGQDAGMPVLAVSEEGAVLAAFDS